MNKSFFKYILGVVTLSLFFLTGCDDDDNLQQSDMFRPISIKVESEKGIVNFSWTPFAASYQGEVSGYEIQVSETEDFANVVYSATTEEPSHVLTSGEVITNTEIYDYYVRVKTLSGVNGTNDSEFTKPTLFSPYRENIFNSVRNQDVSKDFIILRWNADEGSDVAAVTKITLEKLDGTKVGEYPISEDEKTARRKQIDGLEAVTSYIAYIYNGDKRRGRVYPTTRSENETIVRTADELLEAINTSDDNWIIRIAKGEYDLSSSTVSITKSIRLEAYEDVAPTVKVGKFALRGTLGTFSVSGIKFSGANADGVASISDFIEFSKADETNDIPAFKSIETVEIDGCEIYGFTKSFMIYSSTEADIVINNILINNTIVHDVNPNGTSGAQSMDLRNYVANNIKITNSTFYNLGRTLLRMKGATSDQKFELSNCTFYNFSPSSQYFIDFGNADLNGGSYVIKNNILAKTTATQKGYRIGSANSSISADYSYNNEFSIAWSGGEKPSSGWSNSSNILTQDPQFASPDTGDFTLGNSSLKRAASNGGPLGDPRWSK